MPVDTTRVVSPRRTQKKLTEEELKEIDRKRLLGELSCAECRRLKLRCDKKLPCGSCFRRGCESICPLGILAAGQGTRFILADTEQLHEKIYEMSNRIRQLEDALAILQSSVTDQRHPLLSEELLKIKFGSEAINPKHAELSDADSAINKSIDSLGTLSLGSSGKMQYFGGSAGSETLMMRADEEANHSSDDEEHESTPPRPDVFTEVEKLANLFPFTAKGRPNVRALELLETFLPPQEKALEMCDSFMNHAAYFFRPLKADELREGLVPSIYNISTTHGTNTPDTTDDNMPKDSAYNTPPHALATLFFIFALGCLLDLKLEPFNSEAEKYFDLGRAALSLRPVFEPNMFSVKAMGLMATYISLAGKKYTRDSAWCIMSFAAKLGQSIGLHRDSARWNMDPKTVQKRRNLFWEIFACDVSHSLALGRPPAIHLSYVDCEFPTDDDSSLSSTAEHQDGFWRMKHKFARNIYNSVADATLIAKSPSYSTILDLDRKVREISFPSTFNPYVTRDVGPEIFHSSSLSMRDFYASQHRTVTMLYLHRSFFAQAMLDHPTNPLLSPFAPSFLTAYRSGSIIIKASAHLFERCAAMAMRLWFLMYHTFSAAVVVGTVVTRSPNSNIASIAMRDFNVALSLFEQTAVHSARAKLALGVLLKLKDKAATIYQQFSGNSIDGESATSVGLIEDIEDDLAIFGGQMKVLKQKGKNSRSASTSSESPASSPEATSSTSPKLNPAMLGFGLGIPDVHPSLIRYLNQDSVKKTMEPMPLIAQLPRRISIPDAPPPAQQTSAQGASSSGPHISYERSKDISLSQLPQWNASAGTSNSTTPASDSSSSSFLPDSPSRDWATSSQRERRRSGFEYAPYGKPVAGGSGLGQSMSMGAAHNPSPLGLPANAGLQQPSIPPISPMSMGAFSAMAPLPEMRDADMASFMPVDPQPSTAEQATFFAQSAGGGGGGYSAHSFPGHTDMFDPSLTMGLNVDQMLGRSAAMGINLNAGFNWEEVRTSTMDPTGAVEMGLSSESGMDASWISFMRDCGIMDIGNANNVG
ncbi:hypothetical protein BDN70DRAFT_862320 [Pholiota conissans]|uniref:Zn(2)-C6 fungal-type domain-containing protein n=1 Tax=Pholiota conissans TaxID=109636 RepID=A0A9P5YWP4_9AGAR|nr:hypothetical protein BDN70DRAFT_862320 [Pholiota conissans]